MINYKKHNPISPSLKSGLLNVINLILLRSNASINIWKSISLTFISLNEGCWIDLCIVRLFKNLNLFNKNHHMFCCCQNIVGLVALFYRGAYNSEKLSKTLLAGLYFYTGPFHPVYWFPTPSLPIWSNLLYFDCCAKYSAVMLTEAIRNSQKRKLPSQYSSEKVQCFLQ